MAKHYKTIRDKTLKKATVALHFDHMRRVRRINEDAYALSIPII